VIATAWLDHFAVVTFTADPRALAALLPPGVSIDLPLVSAVAYRYRDLGIDHVPGARLSGGQVHFRAYVRVGGERGVWFLATVQDSRWAGVPRWAWGMPWTRGVVDLSEPGPGRVTVAAEGVDLDLEAGRADAPDTTVPKAVSSATVGWFRGRRSVRRFEVAYDDHRTEASVTRVAQVRRFEDLGLIEAGQVPEWAFQRAPTQIRVRLPPTDARHRRRRQDPSTHGA